MVNVEAMPHWGLLFQKQTNLQTILHKMLCTKLRLDILKAEMWVGYLHKCYRINVG
jgi:hypothetical protein